MPETDEILLTALELSRRLRISRRTVSQWAEDGVIPCIRISERTRRYLYSEVMAALKARGQAVPR